MDSQCFLKEDITSEDVSTNSVMPHPQAGEVDLICKEDGIICGLQVFERVFTLLDEKTTVEFLVQDGAEVHKGQLFMAKVHGDIPTLLCGERTALNYLQRMSGIATCHTFRGRIIKRNRNQTSGHQKDNAEYAYF